MALSALRVPGVEDDVAGALGQVQRLHGVIIDHVSDGQCVLEAAEAVVVDLFEIAACDV